MASPHAREVGNEKDAPGDIGSERINRNLADLLQELRVAASVCRCSSVSCWPCPSTRSSPSSAPWLFSLLVAVVMTGFAFLWFALPIFDRVTHDRGDDGA
jgi:hypothetical protein